MCVEHEGYVCTRAVCVIGVGLTLCADWWRIRIGAHTPLLTWWPETEKEAMRHAVLTSSTLRIQRVKQTGPRATVHLNNTRVAGRVFSLIATKSTGARFEVLNTCTYFSALNVSVQTLTSVAVVFPARAMRNGHTQVLTHLPNTNN